MSIPHNHNIIYGTAWKEERTEALVLKAIEMGFRAIDTANQRKHYLEAAVGQALSTAFKTRLQREDVFIQTKFTSVAGQDHRLPYNPNDTLESQVQQSFQSSLDHLQVDHIDSYLLHGPSTSIGISEHDLRIWNAMENIQTEGKTRYIGASNVTVDQLRLLYEKASIKPSIVQNRCFAHLGWDKSVRDFCNIHKITYQGFSLLTANPFVSPQISDIAKKYSKTPEQIIFRFSQQLGMIPLTGTTNSTHMAEDLSLYFDLTNDEVKQIEKIANGSP